MKESIIAFIKTHMMGTLIGIATAVAVGIIVTIAIVSSDEQGEMAILEAGIADIPAIKKEDLDKLGKRYSELNEQFEREIDKLTTGVPNRHNLSDNKVNALKHYGVYGQDNPTKFKNDDYVNGINITYEKTNPNKQNGASNFNDIIAVMAVMYDQKMDTINTDKLLETFETLFWLSHTYIFDSTELYPCRHGCASVDNYKCTDVYKDYKNSNLKYTPFTVKYHDLYEMSGYDEEEDFKLQVPERMCEVHGQKGAGCVWEPEKVCYHSSERINFSEYNDKIYKEEEVEGRGEDAETIVYEGVKYAELGDVVTPEYEDEKYLGPEPLIEDEDDKDEDSNADDIDDEGSTYGCKISRDDYSCIYYMNVKYCEYRENIGKDIVKCKKEIHEIEKKIDDENESFGKKDDPSDSDTERHDEKIENLNKEKDEKNAELQQYEADLQTHISTECEVGGNAKYWCDGFKLCLGHRTHYKCPGHDIIVCYGHTTINVVIKILYGDDIMKKIYEVTQK